MSQFNKIIQIKKIAAVGGGLAPMEKDKYVPGTANNISENKSLPIEYSIEGNLLHPLEVGNVVFVARTKRNGIAANGYFQTSKITEVTDNTFKTQNSIYAYNFL
jgi:hypothetical protein